MSQFDRDVAFVGALIPEGTLPNFWGSLGVPPLQEIIMGDWSLKQKSYDPPLRIRGYFSPGYQQLKQNWMLIKGSGADKVTWMSVTPMELESQVHHAAAANGHVLIGGLGLGILAWNVAKKRNVQRVVVVEHDQAIIDMVADFSRRFNWQDWDKVEVVHSDLFEYRAQHMFDVALLDIWPAVGDDNLRTDLQRFAKRVPAREYAAWGMELDFISWLRENKISINYVQNKHWAEYSVGIGVPLIMTHEPRMSRMALQAALNGVKHEADKAFGPDRRV